MIGIYIQKMKIQSAKAKGTLEVILLILVMSFILWLMLIIVIPLSLWTMHLLI